MSLFFSSKKEIDKVTNHISQITADIDDLKKRIAIITSEGVIGNACYHENLKKLRADIETLSKEVRHTRSDADRMFGIFIEANNRMNDIHTAIVAHLGLEVVVDPAKPATIKLVKKGKK